MKLKASEKTWLAVADGGKALLFENAGDDHAPNLRVLARKRLDIPPNRELASDRPGRFRDPAGGRSAVETTDWHEFEEARFAAALAERLNRAAQAGAFDHLVIAAPAKTLGQLREELSKPAKARLIGEIRADLTKHPVAEIERHFARALAENSHAAPPA